MAIFELQKSWFDLDFDRLFVKNQNKVTRFKSFQDQISFQA